jgi:hypothetical protein
MAGLLVETAVAVDADVDVGPHRLADGGDLGHHPVQLGDADAPVVAVELSRVPGVVDVELHRGEAVLLDVLLRPAPHLRGVETAAGGVAVDAYLVAELAPEELIHGQTEGLSDQVPERRLEGGHHADVHAGLGALEEPAPAHLLLEPVDVERAPADEVALGEVLHHVVGAVDAVHRLTVAGDPLIGLDLHEQAVLAADETAPHVRDPELRRARGLRRPLHGVGEPVERAREGGPGDRAERALPKEGTS